MAEQSEHGLRGFAPTGAHSERRVGAELAPLDAAPPQMVTCPAAAARRRGRSLFPQSLRRRFTVEVLA